jgi:hypothetical protein
MHSMIFSALDCASDKSIEYRKPSVIAPFSYAALFPVLSQCASGASHLLKRLSDWDRGEVGSGSFSMVSAGNCRLVVGFCPEAPRRPTRATDGFESAEALGA